MTNLPNIVGNTWFNSKPLGPEDLRGRVVLADFWTYSCINCRRTLPYLRAWWEKYKDKGFLLIGIHTPEFEFEKDPQNVGQALKDLNVTWPVVLDSNYVNWNSFANRFWPAKYLANREGKIVYTHFGEGAYAQTERKIRELLELENISDVSELAQKEHEHLPARASVSVGLPAQVGGSVCFISTAETYCGYGQGQLANLEGYKEEKVFNYSHPQVIKDGEIGLKGSFLAKKEYVESHPPAQAGEKNATLLLRFHATEVNLVLHSANKEAIVEIKFSGQLPTGDIYGKDVSGDGQVVINQPKMYNVLRSNGLIDGTLELSAKEGNFQAYAFTFSGCEHGS